MFKADVYEVEFGRPETQEFMIISAAIKYYLYKFLFYAFSQMLKQNSNIKLLACLKWVENFVTKVSGHYLIFQANPLTSK